MPEPGLTIFLDSSIWLSFFDFTDDTLEELGKLRDRITAGRARLVVPQQVVDEVSRNREKTLQRAVKSVTDARVLDPGWPRVVQHLDEISKLQALARSFQESQKKVRGSLLAQAEERTLPADRTIFELFGAAGIIPVSDELVSKAEHRRKLGNPPGKSSTLGDQIIWETLLEHVPDGTDLHVVAGDGDFRSLLDDAAPNPFLRDEWATKKHASLYYWQRLRDFAREHSAEDALDLNIPDSFGEPEISSEIARLTSSRNFQEAHRSIADLNRIRDFTDDELREIVDGLATNSQINWIKDDPDVQAFYQRLADENWPRLGPTDREVLIREGFQPTRVDRG